MRMRRPESLAMRAGLRISSGVQRAPTSVAWVMREHGLHAVPVGFAPLVKNAGAPRSPVVVTGVRAGYRLD